MAREGHIDLLQLAEHCGCGAKYPAADLRDLLRGFARADDPRLLVGPETFDDGAVYRLRDDCLIVQTVDFFPPVASQPEVYGRIAAANALSDIYAMGGRPVTAMALLCLPAKRIPLPTARAILAGAFEKITEAGAALVGGHTLTDEQLKFGLSVTGTVEPGQILSNAACQPGDVLVLTKPLGTGLTITAAKAGMAAESSVQQANRFMSALNAQAAAAALASLARAATDITGFGFLGHSWQMAKASRARMRFRAEAAALIDGALEYASLGLVPAGAYANRRFLEGRVSFSADVSVACQDVLFDPQTSGGLLVCLPPDNVSGFQAALSGQVDCCASVIGRVEAGDREPRLTVER
ncbi:MAG: selenide, water dikinase SelD [Phycisphaerae bacterium]|nr:selenide, water dikinase SelD [Phycisphaerae bacterium]